MGYFSEMSKKAINSASGEKMTDWEGRKASDHKDMYTRDTYMPKEDANVRRHYRAKGGEVPEVPAKKGGRLHHKEKKRTAGGDLGGVVKAWTGI
jgi:hypothetical protein